ncbi:Na+/H+ antiporter [Rubrobacter indicoceani]|uniref:Na+/H+ antiporter n=1 Tax=Rubrobacter indicoceani TaxID=2051957 RepID=UPI000E5C1610|nr:Na+/H+ antiporter [Rubrobacter indicoceani]
MNEIQSLIFLLAAAALLTQLSQVVRVPYPVFLVVGGVIIGFIPGLPEVEIAAEVIFLIFLPPLLNASAFSSSPVDLRAHLRAISLLAIGLVLLTAGSVALVGHYVLGLPWAVAFVLGGILAPTDPVAADAVFKRLGVPDRVRTVVGGESLINDGSGLVVYQIALIAAVTGTFSVFSAGASFLLVGGVGVVIGIVAAQLVRPVWRWVEEPSLVVTLSLLIPYGVYVFADSLGVSGILAVVAYGLYQSWRQPMLYSKASTRLMARSFWDVLVFLLEVLLFVLLGQQLRGILSDLAEYSLVEVLLYSALVYGVLVAVRFGWFFSVPYLHPMFNRITRGDYDTAPWRERVVMSWSGMRGAVSLAAALAIPLASGAGEQYPWRDLVVFVTFVVIFATLVVQGLTLAPLTNRLGLARNPSEERLVEISARLTSTRAALSRLEEISESANISRESQDELRRVYRERIRRYRAGLLAGGVTRRYAEESSNWQEWRMKLLDAEREELILARNRGQLSPEAMRRIQRDIDLDESRIGG